jgi:acetyltransferase-like isoleucine patch superfamily enzyme
VFGGVLGEDVVDSEPSASGRSSNAPRGLKLAAYYWRRVRLNLLILRARVLGPPRVLLYDCETNAAILRAFGAKIGTRHVRIHAPLVLHGAEDGYQNLSIGDGCILNGYVYMDLAGKVTLEEGVGLGPGSIVMTHNRYNYNAVLEQRLARQCGTADVLIRRSSSIKAGAIVIKGVTIGSNSVVAAGAVVTNDVESYTIVAGVPARVIQRFDSSASAPADPVSA